MNDLFDIYDIGTAVETPTTATSERLWTFEEYLDAEEISVEKHEFYNGKLILMPGGTDTHSEIGCNTTTAINMSLYLKDDDAHHVYNSDMKVQIPTQNRAVYPDGTVVAGKPIYHLGHNRVIVNPILVVEVLSKSTEKYDKGKKFDRYKTLESFREYVLVSQDKPYVEVHFLENPAENVWKITHYEGLDTEVALESIDCKLKMKQIYHRVFK
jgi:Uma2 family endonuclease